MPGVRVRLAFVLTLCATAPASAQHAPVVTKDTFQSTGEVDAGVFMQAPADVNQPPTCQQLGVPCLTPRTFPDFGAAISAALYPSEIVGIAGELNIAGNAWWSYGTDCEPVGGGRPATCPVRQSNHIRSALAGIRLRTRLQTSSATHYRFFAQLLGGPQWTSIGPRRRVLQPGVGADDYLRNGIAVHVQYDYCFSPDERRDLSTGRYLMGIAIPLGTR